MPIRWITLALASSLMLAAPAGAQEPTNAELIRIEAALRDAGFITWGEIELDDDVWLVEEARRVDGGICDVSVDAETFTISDEDC